MGILTHLDVLAKECENMRTFIKTGFGEGNDYATEGRMEIEKTRLELRNWNRTHVTELDETLKPLPRFDDGEVPSSAPTTGRMVQWLDHRRIADLLDLYDLPFVPTMFLYEKKAIYLRFVGASRALMHRVLDDQPGMEMPVCQTDH
ncbi:MAG: hypothetical protein M1830_010413 [Pleopsidium flavum]|nr:MAG: hypothetical protein M1830_010413 [Pleopsidium flavum]